MTSSFPRDINTTFIFIGYMCHTVSDSASAAESNSLKEKRTEEKLAPYGFRGTQIYKRCVCSPLPGRGDDPTVEQQAGAEHESFIRRQGSLKTTPVACAKKTHV